MKKLCKIVFVLVFVMLVSGGFPDAVAMLGISHTVAMRVVDAILSGASVGTIIWMIIAGGGVLAVSMAVLRQVVARMGRRAAIAW